MLLEPTRCSHFDVWRGWMQMLYEPQTKQPAFIYKIPLLICIWRAQLSGTFLCYQMKSPSYGAVGGKSGGLCDLFITLLAFSVLALWLCAVTYVGSHPLPYCAASHSSCLRNKQWVASPLIINVLGERWKGNKISLISKSIINLNQTYAAFITL